MPVSLPKPSVVDSKKGAFVASRKEAMQSPTVEARVVAIGDVLRRKGYAGAEIVKEAERTLAEVTCEAARSLVSAIDPAAMTEALRAAGADAFEAAFADTDDEKQAFTASSLEALLRRDAAESTLVAAARRAELSADENGATLRAAVLDVERALASVDRCLEKAIGRELTGINAARRERLADLDAAARERACWFSAFVENDDMLPGLAGTQGGTPTAATAASLEASKLPGFLSSERPRRYRDAEASALGHVVAGWATEAERAFLRARAERDPSVAEALREAEAPLPLDEV